MKCCGVIIDANALCGSLPTDLMTTSKVDSSGVFRGISVQASTSESAFLLAPEQVAIRRNGIEFLSPNPIPRWTEVTVDLRSPLDGRPVRGSGVVVECTGDRHAGYVVSLLFMNLTRQSQARWSQLATGASF